MNAAVIVSAYYFLVFLSLGVVLPFFSLWFVSIGLSGQQIGMVAATPSFLVIAINLLIGSLADRAKDWRTAIIIGHWCVAVLITCLFLSQQFYSVWLIWACSGALLLAISPVLDAASIRMSRHRGFPFHRIRSFGSLGFIVGVIGGGVIFDRFGIAWFLPVLAGISWVRAMASMALPKFREGLKVTGSDQTVAGTAANMTARTTAAVELPVASVPSQSSPHLQTNNHDQGQPGDQRTIGHPAVNQVKSDRTQTDRQVLRDPFFIMVLLGGALINGSHGYYYSFGTILWQNAGYSETVISLFWALGVVTEVLIMWWFTRIAKQHSARKLMLFAGVVATVRWIVFLFEPGTGWLLVAQTLHGVTFGVLFLATVNFIANWTSHEIAATAQSFAAMLTTASIAVTTAMSGWIHAAAGFYGYGVMGLVSLIGSLLVLIALGSRSQFS